MSQSFTKGIPIDTDGTMAANSDGLVSSQQAIVEYVTNASSAGWTFLDSATAASATEIVFTSSIDSVYNVYGFIFDQIVSDSDIDAFRIQTSTDGGVSYDSSGYGSGVTGSVTTSNFGGGYITTGGETGTAGNEKLDGDMFLYNPSNTNYTTCSGNLVGPSYTGTDLVYTDFKGIRNSAADVDAIRFYMSTDNISGTIKMYGCCKPS